VPLLARKQCVVNYWLFALLGKQWHTGSPLATPMFMLANALVFWHV